MNSTFGIRRGHRWYVSVGKTVRTYFRVPRRVYAVWPGRVANGPDRAPYLPLVWQIRAGASGPSK